MRISVLVPTYRRPVDLERCLRALEAQTRPADAVVVVCRNDDGVTLELLASATFRLPLTTVLVRVPGVVAALNAGLRTIEGDVVSITDDDAAPWPDWLERIEAHFNARPDIGGLGGRDHMHCIPPEKATTKVGIVQWFGRQIGKHHVGIGAPRYVHMLKGVNMSFRLAAIGSTRFDERLRGTGAQVHNELAFSFQIRRKGWPLLYDPAVAVDHYSAPRFDEDQRSQKSRLAISNAAFNETLILLENLPGPTRPIFLLWAVLIGARDLPGVGQCVRLMLIGEPSWFRLPAVFHGRFAAVSTFYSAQPVPVHAEQP